MGNSLDHDISIDASAECSKRVSQTDTTEYVACCKEKKSCGYGFISALVYGSGEYATAAENTASGNVEIPLAGGAGGFVKAKILHKRAVKGYVAALVTVTEGAKSKAVSVIGDSAAAGIKEEELPATVKQIYENEKLSIEGVKDATTYRIKDGRGAEVTENEFARRYDRTMGSEELADHDQWRRKGSIVGGTVLLGSMAVTIPLTVWGFNNLCADGSTNPHCNVGAAGGAAAFTGGLGAFLGFTLGLTFLGIGISNNDGSPTTDHFLTDSEARLFITRYNRALLRKVVKDTEKAYQDTALLRPIEPRHAPRGLTVSPVVTRGFTGLVGRF